MNHAPGAGSITLPLHLGRPPNVNSKPGFIGTINIKAAFKFPLIILHSTNITLQQLMGYFNRQSRAIFIYFAAVFLLVVILTQLNVLCDMINGALAVVL